MIAAAWTAAAAGDEKAPPKRAMPPKWSADVLDTFFPDAREQLEGQRPDYAALAGRPATGTKGLPPETGAHAAEVGKFRWSSLVRAEVLEDEVKRLARQLNEHVASQNEFKGGLYRACRNEFSLLASWFGVIGEYDAAVRWRQDGPAYRDLFARPGFNCKVGTDQSFREAELRLQDLEALVRGGRVEAQDAPREAIWPEVADRSPLMVRMELAYEERLSKWLADPGEFRGNLADVRHEAELLATLGEIISREGYEFADDEQYAAYAGEVRDAARTIAEAAASEDYARAEEAAAQLGKACIDCHDAFRS